MSALGKRSTNAILALLLVAPLLLPSPAFARHNSGGDANSKRNLKQEKKQLKRDLKSSRKATREWRKHHTSIL